MTTIELTKEASERLIKFKELAKDRGLKRSDWMKILSEILLRSKDDLWWKLITLHTSEEYLLQEAMSDPVMKKRLLALAKSSIKGSNKTTLNEGVIQEESP